jgi:hypothetical protein
MTHPPLRKRFPIHLSTAIVMLVVLSGLLWANLRGRENLYITGIWHIYGWPLDAVATVELDRGFPDVGERGSYSYKRVAVNIAVAFAIFVAVWVLCEWLIRRRAARKEREP